MKSLKTLGLAVVVPAAFMAILGAGTASATRLNDSSGVLPAGTFIKAKLESGTVSKLTTTYKNIECEGSELTLETQNESGAEISANAAFTFSKCNCEVKVLHSGTASIAWTPGTNNGTLASSGTEITTSCSTIFGTVHCIYATASTLIGVLTGSNSTGGTATIDIAEANIPRLTTHSACNEKAKWDANYLVENPDFLNVIN